VEREKNIRGMGDANGRKDDGWMDGDGGGDGLDCSRPVTVVAAAVSWWSGALAVLERDTGRSFVCT